MQSIETLSVVPDFRWYLLKNRRLLIMLTASCPLYLEIDGHLVLGWQMFCTVQCLILYEEHQVHPGTSIKLRGSSNMKMQGPGLELREQVDICMLWLQAK